MPDDPKTSRILNAAQALTAAQGPGWTMTALAKRADVSRGTLYNRFATREEVLAALRTQRGVALDPSATLPARARVFDALVAVASERGLAGTTIGAICERALVSEATFYRTFGDWEGFLEAFAAERTPRAHLDALAEDGFPDPSDLGATLTALARGALAFFAEHRAMIALAMTPGDDARAILEPFLEHEARARQVLVDLLTHYVTTGALHGDPALLAQFFIGMIHGPAILDPERDPTSLVEDAVRVFLRGAGHHPQEHA